MSNNGSIMELVAKSQLDEELIDITNKNSVFNYSIDKKNKYSKGDTLFYPEGKANWSNTVRFNIEKKGDMLYGLYLIVKLPKISIANLNTPTKQDETDTNSKYRIKYTDFIGNTLIEKVSFYINGQLIDEQYGEYMQLNTDLYISDWNRKAMLGLDDFMNKPNLRFDSETIYIPLKFWFCNDVEKPLPLVALQNSELYIDVKFRNFSDCISVLELDANNNFYTSEFTHPIVPLEGTHLQANYYYLDLEERKAMATKEWEIIITQSQMRNIDISTFASLEIDFNHIVKDIMFFIQSNKHKKSGQYFNLSAKLDYPPASFMNKPNFNYKLWNLEPKRHLLARARMLFNSIERIEWRDAKYYYYMQNHENYQNTLQSYVYVYSFNLDPTKDKSYNGCNFSRLENAQLQVEIKSDKFFLGGNNYYKLDDNYELKCYATNFNVLVIKNGLAGLKYIN